MLKMMKYEYKRTKGPLMILFAIFALLEVYFFGATMMKKEGHTGIAFFLFIFLAFACYLFVLIYGIHAYSEDLKSKEGYLVFMTPLSSFKILGAKLLSSLLTGITLVVMLFVLGTIDYSFAAKVYHLESLVNFFKGIMEGLGADPAAFLGGIFIFIIAFLVEFYMTTSLGYLAVSLSSTVLQNKKIKGFISAVIFFVLLGLVNAIAVAMPNMRHLDEMLVKDTVMERLIYMLPQVGLYAAVMIVCYVASSLLLEKKISL